MSTVSYVLAALGVVLLVWGILIYNRFVRVQNMVREAWSGIDVQLRRRADLIPNLVEVVRGYVGHERTTFENVAGLRSGTPATAATGARADAENALTQSIKSIFALAEAYPDLKANEEFLALQRTLVEVEDQIQYARRYYNGAARDFNILVRSFPSNLVAAIFHYQPYEYFEVTLSTERDAPDIDLSR